MSVRVKEKLPREAMRRRQLEIEQCLAAYGLVRGPRRLLSDASAASEAAYGRRLSAALTSLGPVFSALGCYLSSRIDLLPAQDCLELAALPDRTAVKQRAAVWDLINQEFSGAETYAAFNEEPFESRLTFQLHRAWLQSGEAVVVKVARPELEPDLACDLELLPLLKGALASGTWADLPIERVIADFRQTLQQQADLIREAEALELLQRDSKEFGMLSAPRVHWPLCSSKVLTLELLPGISLDQMIAQVPAAGQSEDAPAKVARGQELDRSDLAHRLYRVWLRQALRGRVFPVEPRPENILILPNQQIAFIGGTFASLASDAKTNLLAYLVAAATEDPDKACAYLLTEMEPEERAIGEDGVRNRFRQIVPFRDGGWSNKGDSDSLAEHLFVQWRLASRCGYQPRAHLLSFYRGLFLIAAAVRRLAPGRDPLSRELEEVRLMEVLGQFQDLIGVRQLSSHLDKYAAIMVELPKRLDQVLTLAAEGNARVKLHMAETATYRRQKNSLAVVIALLLVLVAVAVLSHHFAAASVARGWVDRVSALVFVLLGALLLRAATRAW